MYTIMHDRIFWIYLIVTLFFVVIGIGSIIGSADIYTIGISLLWLISNIALMIVIYHTAMDWAPIDPATDSVMCVADPGCMKSSNRIWIMINILFIVLLLLSTLWAAELYNVDAGVLQNLSGIFILIGGILLCGLTMKCTNQLRCALSFWSAVAYLLIWFGLTLYTIL